MSDGVIMAKKKAVSPYAPKGTGPVTYKQHLQWKKKAKQKKQQWGG